MWWVGWKIKMAMYKKPKMNRNTFQRNESVDGETIESKFHRIINNKEPITDGAPIIYTERKDGVSPAYNIRTDRWEIAVDGMDKVQKSRMARREERAKSTEAKVIKLDNEVESTQGKTSTE